MVITASSALYVIVTTNSISTMYRVAILSETAISTCHYRNQY
jgi:hypothetical protein